TSSLPPPTPLRSPVSFFTTPSPSAIYTLSLHDALPICRGARELRERLRLGDVPGLVPERFLGALLGSERGRLVDILGAQRRIRRSEERRVGKEGRRR